MATEGQEIQLSRLVVDVWPNVNFINKPYSYLIESTAKNFEILNVGTVVKILFHGRTVKGWVAKITPVFEFEQSDSKNDFSTLKKVLSCVSVGPKPSIVKLAEALKDRYFVSPGYFLNLATAKKNVLNKNYYEVLNKLDVDHTHKPELGQTQLSIVSFLNELVKKIEAAGESIQTGTSEIGNVAIVRHPPNSDLAWLISELSELNGSLIVLTPTASLMNQLYATLKLNGIDVAYEGDYEPNLTDHKVYIGNRNSVFTSKPSKIAGMIVIDFHNTLYIDQRAPCFSAVDAAGVRSKLENFILVLCSTSPAPELMFRIESNSPDPIVQKVFSYPTLVENNSWPYIEVFKKFEEENKGLLSEVIIRQIESVIKKQSRKVIVVFQQKGYINSLACVDCGSIVVCDRCGTALKSKKLGSDAVLYCQFCDSTSLRMCLSCGSFKLKTLRKGFSAILEELKLVLDSEIKLTDDFDEFVNGNAEVLVNTSSVLNRRYRTKIGLVVFLDFDQFLQRPAISAINDSLGVVVDACNLVGKKSYKPAGKVLIQSGVVDHYIFEYLKTLNYEIYLEHELRRRELFGYPPYVSLAYLSSSGKKVLEDFISSVSDPDVEVLGPTATDEYIIKANLNLLRQYLNLDNRNSKIKVKLTL